MKTIDAWRQIDTVMRELTPSQRYRTLMAFAIAYDMPLALSGTPPKYDGPGDFLAQEAGETDRRT